MIVYVLFVHKISISKRKVCFIFIKIEEEKNIFKSMGFFRWFFWVFLVGFLLPTLAEGGAHGGERVPLPQQRRRHAALPGVPALSVAHPRYLGHGRPSRATQGTIFRSNEYRGTNIAYP
jgi:hypothetical protein